jgi:hypothetical protein
MQTAACQIRRPVKRHSTTTATASSTTTDRVTVKQSPPFHRVGGKAAACIQPSPKARRALRRSQRPRAMHFSHRSVPSLVCAPQAHIRAARQPARRYANISPPYTCRLSLLPRARTDSTAAPVPLAPGNHAFPDGPPSPIRVGGRPVLLTSAIRVFPFPDRAAYSARCSLVDPARAAVPRGVSCGESPTPVPRLSLGHHATPARAGRLCSYPVIRCFTVTRCA